MRLQSTEADLEALKRYLRRKRKFPVEGIRIQHSTLADDMNAKKARAFAHTQEGSTIIYCSAAMEQIPAEARCGILLHECGHIVAHAFDWDAEITVDEYILTTVPESGYCYKNVRYAGSSGRVREAKAVEHLSRKFIQRIYR